MRIHGLSPTPWVQELRRALGEEVTAPPIDWASDGLDALRLPSPPGLARPDEGRAHALAAAGEHRASMAAFAEVLQAEPESRYAWLGLGANALALGDTDRARQAFLQHLRRVPTDGAGWANLAEVELRRGDLAAAERSLDQARKADTSPRLERRIDALGRGLARRRA